MKYDNWYEALVAGVQDCIDGAYYTVVGYVKDDNAWGAFHYAPNEWDPGIIELARFERNHDFLDWMEMAGSSGTPDAIDLLEVADYEWLDYLSDKAQAIEQQ